MAKVVGQYGGIYASHMRSEGRTQMAAIDEAIRIGREAGIPRRNFPSESCRKRLAGATCPKSSEKIEAARASRNQDVAADMYPYLAGGTALASALPPWVADGGMAKTPRTPKRSRNFASKIQKRNGRPEHGLGKSLISTAEDGAGVIDRRRQRTRPRKSSKAKPSLKSPRAMKKAANSTHSSIS